MSGEAQKAKAATRRLRSGDRVVLATHNKGKYRENAALLAPYGLEVLSAGDLWLPEPEETGATFEENAVLKARAACAARSEEHTSELQSLMRISYAVFCLKKKQKRTRR